METTNNKTAPIVQEKERNQVTLELTGRMRLTGMANAFAESLSATYYHGCWQGSGTTALRLPLSVSSREPGSVTRHIPRK